MLISRPTRSKKGETTSLTIMPVFTLILMMALILLPLLKYTMDIGTQTHFDRVYISRDLAGVINTVIGTPNNIKIYYPQNIQGLITEMDGDNLHLKQSDDQLHPLITASAIFRMKNQAFVFDRIISEKERKVCRILKQSNVVRGGETVGPMEDIYYVPEKLEQEALAYEITYDDATINGHSVKNIYDKLNAILYSQPTPDRVLKIHLQYYTAKQTENGLNINIPRDDKNLAIFAANIANSVAGLSFNSITRLDPIYVSYHDPSDQRMIISLGNPNIADENFIDDDTYLIMILSSIRNGIIDSYHQTESQAEEDILSPENLVQPGVDLIKKAT
ncbi:hypothetical protein K9M79_02750 [Candidatus Woesearchaeota archaeon]|nr:hypothetical protein [Candidatus Woesearchaeota archaeon]